MEEMMREEAKRKVVMLFKDIDEIEIEGNNIDPWIVIAEMRGKPQIIINTAKIYRVLHHKLTILQGLDVMITDKIKEVLQKMALTEKKQEEEWRKNEIRKPKSAERTSSDTRRSGTPPSGGEFV